MSEDEKRFAHRSRAIQKNNEDDYDRDRNKVKLLLLGAGESGKSTVFKQMRQLYGDKYTTDELAQFRLFIHQNVIQTIEDLCDIARKEIEAGTFPDDPIIHSTEFRSTAPENGQSDMRNFRRFPDLTLQRAQAVDRLWKSPLFQSIWHYILHGEGRKRYQIIESAKGFLDRVEELSNPLWIPEEQGNIPMMFDVSPSFSLTLTINCIFGCNQDILHCRVRTSGIREERLLVPASNTGPHDTSKRSRGMSDLSASSGQSGGSGGTGSGSGSGDGHSKIFQFFDVGGQRNERRKWIHCFEGVHAVIFIVALSEFDMSLWEDGTANRMEDSIQVRLHMLMLGYNRHQTISLSLTLATSPPL